MINISLYSLIIIILKGRKNIDSFADENYDKNYLNKIENDYNQIMDKLNPIDKFILMLKMKYITVTTKYQSDEQLSIILRNFSEFLNIYCINKSNEIIIEKINYINDKVRDFLFSKFELLLCEYINRNEKGIFNSILTSSIEGKLLERQIIIKLINNTFNKKLNIQRIYCAGDFMETKLLYNKNDTIVIIQKQENAPLFHFALITLINEIPTLKVY